MGLPAFDTAAFDEASRALADAPRVSTTIFMSRQTSPNDASGRKLQAFHDADLAERVFAEWRIASLAAHRDLRAMLTRDLSSFDLGEIKSASARLVQLCEVASRTIATESETLREFERETGLLIERMVGLSSDDARFLRKQAKRAARAMQASIDHLGRLSADLGAMREQVDAFVAANTVVRPEALPPDALRAHAAAALARPPDEARMVSVARRLLDHYPEAAAYLAR